MKAGSLRSAAVVLAMVLAACSSGETTTTAGAAAPPAPDVASLTAKVGDAVWRVETEGCGWLGSGSAFAVGRRHLVTNRHVIGNDSSPGVRSRDGKRLRGRVIGAAAHPDVAVIEVPEDMTVTLPWAPTDGLVEQERLVVFGYPRPEKEFRASSGSIVSFQGGREAALSDAAIEKGSSGGPAVRVDGSVVGVVTRMSLPTSPAERVAIIFTASAVQATVERFVRQPQDILSDCGLGPDYVPPVPKHYDVKARPPPHKPPPVAPPIEVPATTTTEAAAPIVAAPNRPPPGPTTTAVPCPTGRAVAVVDQMTATESEEPDWWAVTVIGTVRNESSGFVSFGDIAVTISGDPPREAKGFPDTRSLAPGESTPWRADDFVRSPRGQPTRATAEMSWSWSESRFGGCPSD